MRKLTVWRTSRNWTFTAESHRPTPSDVVSANRKNAGRKITFSVGQTWKYAIIASKTRNANAKSTTPDSTADIGTISRGKYTFLIRLELPTRLSAAPTR